MSVEMNWAKHAKKKTKPMNERRLSLPISVELEKVIAFFKSKNPEFEFSDSAVLMTFIEAGIKIYVIEMSKKSAPKEIDND